MTNLDTLYSKWLKLGYGFSGNPHKGNVDIEKTIIESIEVKRADFENIFLKIVNNGEN